LSWTRVPERDDGVGLEVHEALGRTRADRSELLRSLGSWSTVTELVRVRLLTEDPLRPDPQVLPLVMMRVIDTAAALRARPAPAGLQGTIRLVVEDGTVPAGSCRAEGTWIVTATEGTVGVSQEGAVDDDPTNPSGSAELGAAVLDIHAASLLLTGGRRLADARRLGLRA